MKDREELEYGLRHIPRWYYDAGKLDKLDGMLLSPRYFQLCRDDATSAKAYRDMLDLDWQASAARGPGHAGTQFRSVLTLSSLATAAQRDSERMWGALLGNGLLHPDKALDETLLLSGPRRILRLAHFVLATSSEALASAAENLIDQVLALIDERPGMAWIWPIVAGAKAAGAAPVIARAVADPAREQHFRGPDAPENIETALHEVLAALYALIPAEDRAGVLQSAAQRAMSQPLSILQARALSTLAALAEVPELGRAFLSSALRVAAATALSDSRAGCVTAIAGAIGKYPDLLPEAARCALATGRQRSRADALAALLPYMPAGSPLIGAVLTATRRMGDPLARAGLLPLLLSRVDPETRPRLVREYIVAIHDAPAARMSGHQLIPGTLEMLSADEMKGVVDALQASGVNLTEIACAARDRSLLRDALDELGIPDGKNPERGELDRLISVFPREPVLWEQVLAGERFLTSTDGLTSAYVRELDWSFNAGKSAESIKARVIGQQWASRLRLILTVLPRAPAPFSRELTADAHTAFGHVLQHHEDPPFGSSAAGRYIAAYAPDEALPPIEAFVLGLRHRTSELAALAERYSRTGNDQALRRIARNVIDGPAPEPELLAVLPWLPARLRRATLRLLRARTSELGDGMSGIRMAVALARACGAAAPHLDDLIPLADRLPALGERIEALVMLAPYLSDRLRRQTAQALLARLDEAAQQLTTSRDRAYAAESTRDEWAARLVPLLPDADALRLCQDFGPRRLLTLLPEVSDEVLMVITGRLAGERERGADEHAGDLPGLSTAETAAVLMRLLADPRRAGLLRRAVSTRADRDVDDEQAISWLLPKAASRMDVLIELARRSAGNRRQRLLRALEQDLQRLPGDEHLARRAAVADLTGIPLDDELVERHLQDGITRTCEENSKRDQRIYDGYLRREFFTRSISAPTYLGRIDDALTAIQAQVSSMPRAWERAFTQVKDLDAPQSLNALLVWLARAAPSAEHAASVLQYRMQQLAQPADEPRLSDLKALIDIAACVRRAENPLSGAPASQVDQASAFILTALRRALPGIADAMQPGAGDYETAFTPTIEWIMPLDLVPLLPAASRASYADRIVTVQVTGEGRSYVASDFRKLMFAWKDSPDLLPSLIRASQTVDTAWYQARQASDDLERFTAELASLWTGQDADTCYRLWCQQAQAYARVPRPVLAGSYGELLAPLIFRLGGVPAVRQALAAITDLYSWVP